MYLFINVYFTIWQILNDVLLNYHPLSPSFIIFRFYFALIDTQFINVFDSLVCTPK